MVYKTPAPADKDAWRRQVQLDSEERRRIMRAYLDNAGLTAAEMSRMAGLASPSALNNFLGGYSQSLSHSTVMRIAAALNVAPSVLDGMPPIETEEDLQQVLRRALGGGVSTSTRRLLRELAAEIAPELVPDQVPTPARTRQAVGIPVAIDLEVGAFRRALKVSPDRRSTSTLCVTPEQARAGAFGARVMAGGAQAYPAGTTLVCLPVNGHEEQLTHGRRVIVQRTRHVGQREFTVREIRGSKALSWLVLGEQPDVRLPSKPNAKPWTDVDQFVLLGIVVVACVPEG